MPNAEEQQLISEKSSNLKSPGLQRKKTVKFNIDEDESILNENLSPTQSNNTYTKKKPKKILHKSTPIAKNNLYPFGGLDNVTDFTILLPASLENDSNYSTFRREGGASTAQARKKNNEQKSKGIDKSTNTEPKAQGKRLVKHIVDLTSQGSQTEMDLTDYKPIKGKRKKRGDGDERKTSKVFGTQTDADITKYKTKRSREKYSGDESQTNQNHKARPITTGSLPSESCATQTDANLTNLKPKRNSKRYSEDEDTTNDSFRAVQSKPNNYKNKQYYQLDPKNGTLSPILYRKSEQPQPERKEGRPSSNKISVDRKRVSIVKKRHPFELNDDKRKISERRYSQTPQQQPENKYPSRFSSADDSELGNYVDIYIPCELHPDEENIREKRYPSHQDSENEKVTKDSYGSVESKSNNKGKKRSYLLYPEDETQNGILHTKAEKSQPERKKGKSFSNNNYTVDRKRVSDGEKHHPYEINQDKRKLKGRRYNQTLQQHFENDVDTSEDTSDEENIREKRYPKHQYSKNGRVNKDSYGPVESKPNNKGNKHSYPLHPEDETHLKPEQSQPESKKQRLSSNKNNIIRKNHENKYRPFELNQDGQRFNEHGYSQHPRKQSKQPYPLKSYADKSELSNDVEIFIPCERYEEKLRAKDHQDILRILKKLKDGSVTNENYKPIGSEPKNNHNNLSQSSPKNKNHTTMMYPKSEYSQFEKNKRRSSSNKNDDSRKRVSDANKHRSLSNRGGRRLSEKRNSQEPVGKMTKRQLSSDIDNLSLEKRINTKDRSDPRKIENEKRKQSRKSEISQTKENRNNSNPPLDREALKAKLESIIGEQAKEVKEKERKRTELLKMLKEAAAEKKKKPEVDPIIYSHSNSNPPLDREALVSKLENIIGEQAKQIQVREAKINQSKPFRPYNPQSQRRPGGDADNRRSKGPRREAGGLDQSQPAPRNLLSKAPRHKSHIYAMKRYHIQIPEKEREETPFNVRFNLNDEQSVDMTYDGPVKINNYYSSTNYY